MPDSPSSDLLKRLGDALSGQYRIERVLGQGGMGTVFLAQDLTLDRPVAIKVISPEVGTSPEIRERFVLEAKTVARLRHPHLVAVYAAGEADGLLYFVMEFVPGESLRDRLTRDGRIPLDEASGIMRDLALALDYAHAAGVVHRDVKPENVLLDRDSGRAMLMDFGVARAIEGDSRLTGAGFVLGSPHYMSPEQASGETLDGRSDLYSLGLIGYEMLSGGRAIDAPTAASILAKHLTERPTPLALKVPGTPAEFASTIDRLLEKSSAARFQRGGAVAAALVGETFDSQTPTNQIGRGHSAARSGRGRQRVGRTWLVGGAVLAITAIGGTLWWRAAAATTNEKAWLVAPFEVQGGDRSLDWMREGSLNMLTLSLAQWTDLQVVEYERVLDLLRDAGLDDQPRVGLEAARGVARRAGAGRVVMGQITALGDSMIVTANLYDVETGRSTDKARVAAVRTTDPRPLFESVASELLNLVGAPRITIELAKQTTTSIEGYRHYLDGLRYLNRWRLREADSAFSLALAADSTFALAYYKKSLGLGWLAPGLKEQDPLLVNALKYVDRLPPRQQELVRGHVELSRGFEGVFINRDTVKARQLFLAARNRLARLVAGDTADAEAWYALADADFHLASNTAMAFSADSVAKYYGLSLRGFSRTISLDSSFHLAFQHLADLYQQAARPRAVVVLEGDSLRPAGSIENERRVGSAEYVGTLRETALNRAREAAMGWRAADPDAPQAVGALSETYLQMKQPDSAIAVLVEAQRRPTLANAFFAWRIPVLHAAYAHPKAGPAMLAVAKATPIDSLKRLNAGERITALFSLVTVAGQSGMPSLLDESARLLPQVDPILPGSDIPSEAVIHWINAGMRLGMGLSLTPAIKQTVREGIALLDAETPSPSPNARSQYFIPYLAYLATRDTVYLSAVQRWAGTPQNDFPELRALAALQRKDSAAALKIARSFTSADSVRRAQLSLNGLRVATRAEVFAELGDLRSAVAMYEAIDPARFFSVGVPEVGWPGYIRSYLARGRLYEQLGERDKAIAAYQQFLTLWADAEAPLQPQLREAREAIARLKEATSVPVKGAVRGGR